MKPHIKETLDILERLSEERGKAVLAFAQEKYREQKSKETMTKETSPHPQRRRLGRVLGRTTARSRKL